MAGKRAQPELSGELISHALRAAEMIIEWDVHDCVECNYGRGATGQNPEGGSCEECHEQRRALELVKRARASFRTEGTSSGELSK